MADVIVVTDASFEAEVLKADRPVLVDFFTTWCGPCRLLAPVVEEVAREYAGRAKVAKIDAEENPQAAAAHEVMGFPTLVVFKAGREVGRILGLTKKRKIADELDRALGV